MYPQMNNLSPCCLSINVSLYLLHDSLGRQGMFENGISDPPFLLAFTLLPIVSIPWTHFTDKEVMTYWNETVLLCSWLRRSLLSNVTCSYPLSQRTEQTFCEAIPFTADANARKWTICVSFWLLKTMGWMQCPLKLPGVLFFLCFQRAWGQARSLFCFVFTLNEK